MGHSFDHYTEAVDTIKELKSSGQDDELEQLLLWCVEATEAEARRENLGVAPYYYGELAKLYRKRKDYDSEVAILERYASQPKAPGAKPEKLAKRLARAHDLQGGA
jgi:hypothetical protein